MIRVGIFRNLALLHSKNDIPEFLVKTTLYCSIVAAVFLSVFVIKNWLADNQTLFFLLSAILVFCLINIWFGLKNQYSLFLNTYLFLPITFSTFLLTFYSYGIAASYWPFMLVLACYFILPLKRALTFNSLLLIIFIPHSYYFLEYESALRFSVALFGISLFVYFGITEIEKLHRVLKLQAITDPLTGLYNRSLLDDSLAQSIGQYHRTNIPVSLISLDIDHFKQINDNLGHDIGDVVLKRLGELLRNRTRSTDRIFRVGGEEFLILVHNTDKQKATQIAEELRLQIEKYEFIPLQQVTISFGVAQLDNHMDKTQWLKASDVMLYKAKQSGRNCVVS